MIGVVAATGFLGQTPPPRALAMRQAAHHHAGDRRGPAVQRFEESKDGVVIGVDVDPAAVGHNIAAVTVAEEDGSPVAALAVETFWTLPELGIEDLGRPLAQTAEGRFAGPVDLPLPGQWRVRIEVLVDEFNKVSVEDRIIVSDIPR